MGATSTIKQMARAGRKAFGNFGVKYDNFSDTDLILAYQKGDADALAEYANRHSNDMIANSTRGNPDATGPSTHYPQLADENFGEFWENLRKWAKEYDPSQGANPKTWFDNKSRFDRMEKSRVKSREFNRQVNVDDFPAEGPVFTAQESPVDYNGFADFARADVSDRLAEDEQRNRDLTRLLGSVYKNSDDRGREVIDAYKQADYYQTPSKRSGDSDIPSLRDAAAYSSIASGAQMKNRKSEMIGNLPQKLQREVMDMLRNRRK